MEKSGAFTNTLWDAIEERICWDKVKAVNLWADTGPHYRCDEFITHYGFTFAERRKIQCHLKFGLEKHGKGKIDGFSVGYGRYDIHTLAKKRFQVSLTCSKCTGMH